MKLPSLMAIGAVAAGGVLVALESFRKSSEGFTMPLDDYAFFDPTQPGECGSIALPGVLIFRSWVIANFGERPGSPQNILRDCSLGSPSEHWTGRAWDWMIPSKDAAIGLLDTLLAPCPNGQEHELVRRAGIMNMIYDRMMWRAYPHGEDTRVWAPYTGSNPHTDHIHFSFSRAGALAETSFYRNFEPPPPESIA